MSRIWDQVTASVNRVTTRTFGTSAVINGVAVDSVIPLGRWQKLYDENGNDMSTMEYRVQIRTLDVPSPLPRECVVSITGDDRSYKMAERQRGTDGMDVLVLHEVT